MDRVQARGEHTITWDGRDSRGAQVSSGVYLCRVSYGGGQMVGKMILTK
jgi:flagellar hook assembly protein FlgD